MNLVKRLRPFFALFAVLGLFGAVLVACGSDNSGVSDEEAVASIAPAYPEHPEGSGKFWCVYPEGAREACQGATGDDGNPIPEERWQQVVEQPEGSYREDDDNNTLDVLLWMWFLGHMSFFNSDDYVRHYYHDDYSRNRYTERVRGYERTYSRTITKVTSDPKLTSKYSSYNDAATGQKATETEVKKDPSKLRRMSNDRRNKPLNCSAGEITSRVNLDGSTGANLLPSAVTTKKPSGSTNRPGSGSTKKPDSSKSTRTNNPGSNKSTGSSNNPGSGSTARSRPQSGC